ncbi:hypothetical protein TNCV_2600611 [Trichonephila clavipes]|nr:hypothetical protein TNCV_2600611 [Trichonephila clavipes]
MVMIVNQWPTLLLLSGVRVRMPINIPRGEKLMHVKSVVAQNPHTGRMQLTVLFGVYQWTLLYYGVLGWGGFPLTPRITSGSWTEWGFLTVKDCRGDDSGQDSAIF